MILSACGGTLFNVGRILNSTIEEVLKLHVTKFGPYLKPTNDLISQACPLGSGLNIVLETFLEVCVSTPVAIILVGTKVPLGSSNTLKT